MKLYEAVIGYYTLLLIYFWCSNGSVGNAYIDRGSGCRGGYLQDQISLKEILFKEDNYILLYIRSSSESDWV